MTSVATHNAKLISSLYTHHNFTWTDRQADKCRRLENNLKPLISVVWILIILLMKIGNPGSFMFNLCYISSICIAVTVHLTVWNMFSWAIAVIFSPFVSLRSILTAAVQAKDVLCVSQDSLCGGPLSLHGRVESPAGGVWRADKESRSRSYPSGTGFQVPLDLCCGVFHGVLQNPVRHLPKGQAGELTLLFFILTWKSLEISSIMISFTQ